MLAAADEVGLSVEAVRRSLAIERLGPPIPAHHGDRFVGATVVSVDNEIAGTAPEILERMDAWMVDGHHLRRDLRRVDPAGGVVVWTKRAGLVGAAVRTVRTATGEGKLGDLRSVTATARDTGLGGCVVRVSADRSNDRQTSIVTGAAAAATATAVFVAGAVVATPAVLLATPVALFVGLGVAARGKRRESRTRHEIERLLDTVDQGIDPTRLRVDVARRVTGRTRS